MRLKEENACMKMAAGKTIAFHSYKGGTGKTTLITNLAALYAKHGFNVCLLDLDIYAPSLVSYFRKTPSCYVNDLLNGEATISDVVVNLSSELGFKGKLLVGFSSPRKADIDEIEFRHNEKWQLNALRLFLAAKKDLLEEYGLNYVFLDTSPGIRIWSINTLAAADMIFLLMKDSDMDIEGTRKMINDIYDALTRFGSKYFLVLNKVPGALPSYAFSCEGDEEAFKNELERVVGAQVVGSIPCFCDIQFSRHEFLFSVKKPDHPFSKRIAILAENIEKLAKSS
jgi:chromosome partitioning protein